MSLTVKPEAPQIRQDRDLRPRRLCIPIPNDQYFSACARIRGITATALMVRLLQAVAEDLLVANILDDQDELRVRRRYENRYKPSDDAKPQLLSSCLPES